MHRLRGFKAAGPGDTWYPAGPGSRGLAWFDAPHHGGDHDVERSYGRRWWDRWWRCWGCRGRHGTGVLDVAWSCRGGVQHDGFFEEGDVDVLEGQGADFVWVSQGLRVGAGGGSTSVRRGDGQRSAEVVFLNRLGKSWKVREVALRCRRRAM